MHKRRVCVVSGSRAEYGLLYWLMKEIQADPDLDLQIIATGMHLSPEFGLTYKIIENDGFHINEKVEMLLSSDTPVGIAKSIGLGVIGFADAFARLNPDVIVLLGDRFEIYAAAQAALVSRIPIAHIHGGESTEGLIDEAIRHSISKMAHLHFVANDIYKKRVIQLGENPEHVFNYGAPGLDNIKRLEFLSVRDLEKQLGINFTKPSFLITYHPVTLKKDSSAIAINELLRAFDSFPEATLLFTMPNADMENRLLNDSVISYVKKNRHRAKLFASLGQLLYLSTMKSVDVVIGNSSSGIIEAPFLKIPTVNIGDRQKGRLKADSIIDCKERTEDIEKAINRAMSSDFRKTVLPVESLYGDGNASYKIKEKIKTVNLHGIIQKIFYDMVYEI